jgi:tRNA nucleotidyltransferase/poly(A) polymerase
MQMTHWVPDWLVTHLSQLAPDTPIWLVGGAVRDRLLNRPEPDLDFVVEGEARAVARRLADAIQGSYYDLDRARGTGRVVIQSDQPERTHLDFATLRGEGIEQDLRRRDFTINAMAVRLGDPGRLIDPTGGLQDLRDHILRSCSPTAVEDDPVRALRGVRIAAELGLAMEARTISQIREAAPLLVGTSPERIRDEIMQIFGNERPAKPVRVLRHLGMLDVVFPELAPDHGERIDAQDWEMALSRMDALSILALALQPEHDPEAVAGLAVSLLTARIGRFRASLGQDLSEEITYGRRVRQLLFMAAMYSRHALPIARGEDPVEPRYAPLIESRGEQLRLSRVEIERLGNIVRNQGRLARLTARLPLEPRSIYRFHRATGAASSQVILLDLASLLARHSPATPPRELWLKYLDAARSLLEAKYGQGPVRLDAEPLLSGGELIRALDISPGPEVGRLLSIIREAQAVGEISEREEAVVLARREHRRA